MQMTIGELSRRTDVAVKTLRAYEGMGLIYTVGRSHGNYRLFDESALWCVEVIRTLRSLGLTVAEIREIAAIYLGRPEQQQVRRRIDEFEISHAAELAPHGDADLASADPRSRAVGA